ncbi:FUSC family protein [Acinetobacter chinensis]|uniref:FUSC family protein n=1 Tax=Acinetobacter chinensis TaxID=2004650 RepID=A0A3B7LZ05_9GAMM|nr:FUSC family protein [Acinetobacter chinensis]AXY55553.1 FUSC family protein [Acinetobacter chinensis]
MLLYKQILAFRPNKMDWIFATKTFIAGMLSLYFAFILNLSYPIWAIGTVFVIASPYSGMTASKSIYRLLGTLFGAVFAVAVTPLFINMPMLLILILAIWVGFCLYVSLLDRTPRSYVFMLAGYTAVIICFNAIYYIDTISIFDMALGRFLEISLGVVCSAVVTATIFPQPLAPVLQTRVAKTMQDTRSLYDQILLDEYHQPSYTTLLASITRDTSDIHVMAVHLSYETSGNKLMTKPIQELLHQVTMLVANLVAMSERIKQLDQIDMSYREHLRLLHGHVAAFLDDKHEIHENELRHLPATFNADFERMFSHARSEQQVMLGGLKMDIRHFIQNVRAVKLIWRRILQGDNSLPGTITPLTTSYPSLHRDHGVAVRGGVSASITIFIAAALWILSGWKPGFMMAEMAAISACILTAMDDPVPALKMFIRANLYAVVIVFIYAYGIFPHVTTFWEMAVVLAPFIIYCLMLFPHPPLTGLALPLLMGVVMGLNIQNRYALDQITFFDFSIGTAIGPIISVCVVQMVRSMSPDITAQRMLALHYRDMRHAIRMHYGVQFKTHLRGMLDRIGVLNTKMVQSASLKAEMNAVLIESSATIDLTRLNELKEKLSSDAVAVKWIVALQHSLETWFKAREKQQQHLVDSAQIFELLERTENAALEIGDEDIQKRIRISVNNIRNGLCQVETELKLQREMAGA